MQQAAAYCEYAGAEPHERDVNARDGNQRAADQCGEGDSDAVRQDIQT